MIDDKTRAQHANNILNNPVFQQAVEVMSKEIIKAWEECPARDTEAKEYYWQLYKNTQKFVNIFRGYVDAGKLQIEREMQEQSALQKAKDNVTKFFRRY